MVGTTVYFWGVVAVLAVNSVASDRNYYGKYIGKFNSYAHNISGKIYAVDEDTLCIKDLYYDGRGPDAFFWVGKTNMPTPNGIIVPHPQHYKGSEPPVLSAFTGQTVVLHLPNGLKIKDLRWISIWCRRFTVNFGDCYIPAGLEPPRPKVLPEFKRLAHGLRSGNITILDTKTIYIPDLHYDGAGPDAYFWVGTGPEPGPDGIKVPDEEGSLEPLSGYEGEDIQLTLPGNLTCHDIDWLAMWCVKYRHNFGHVYLTKPLDVPPALGLTKITTTEPPPSKRPQNCLDLIRDKQGRKMQVLWETEEDTGMLKITLIGRIKENQYMAFGPSAKQGVTQMVPANIVVAHYEKDFDMAVVQDYFMDANAQCDGRRGVCPAYENKAQLIRHSRINGVTTIEFRRPPWPIANPVTIIAAVGALNTKKQANYHFSLRTGPDVHKTINFDSTDDDTCEGSLEDENHNEEEIRPWPPAKIECETTFRAVIGPTGGKRGYSSLTGQPSWGICWFINDLLIPEIYVERGKTYTFIVEGGGDSTNPAHYHPLYITDNNEGGYGQKSQEEQEAQIIYAGVAKDSLGYTYPTAVGRYCEWEHKTIDKSRESETFDEYFKTLRLVCQDGEPAYFNWTVPVEAPDLLYYQCYTHNNLGWKIHVVEPGSCLRRGGLSSNSAYASTTKFIGSFSFLSLLILWLQ